MSYAFDIVLPETATYEWKASSSTHLTMRKFFLFKIVSAARLIAEQDEPIIGFSALVYGRGGKDLKSNYLSKFLKRGVMETVSR